MNLGAGEGWGRRVGHSLDMCSFFCGKYALVRLHLAWKGILYIVLKAAKNGLDA